MVILPKHQQVVFGLSVLLLRAGVNSSTQGRVDGRLALR